MGFELLEPLLLPLDPYEKLPPLLPTPTGALLCFNVGVVVVLVDPL